MGASNRGLASPRHFVVTAIGSLGDFLPAMGLARELARLGHRVQMVAPTYFEPHADALVEFVGYGSAASYARDLADPRGIDRELAWLTEYCSAAALPYQIRAVDAAFAESGPACVVIGQPNAVGALWAAKRHGLATFSLLTAPNHMAMLETPRAISETALRAAFRGYGMEDPPPAVTDPSRTFIGDYVFEFDHIVEMFPPWFDALAFNRRANTLAGTFPGETTTRVISEVEAFARDGAAPWAFFPGSGLALLKARPDFFDLAAETCRRTGRRAILLDPRAGGTVKRADEAVIHCGMTNLNRLLPLCAGFFHHGGIGSTSQALAAGIPHVVAPVVYDQPTNAAWLQAHGVAAVQEPAALNTAGMEQLLETAETLARRPRVEIAERLRAEGGAQGLARRIAAQLAQSESHDLELA